MYILSFILQKHKLTYLPASVMEQFVHYRFCWSTIPLHIHTSHFCRKPKWTNKSKSSKYSECFGQNSVHSVLELLAASHNLAQQMETPIMEFICTFLSTWRSNWPFCSMLYLHLLYSVLFKTFISHIDIVTCYCFLLN